MWTPSSRMFPEHCQQRVGHSADPGLDRRAVGYPLRHQRGDSPVLLGGRDGVGLDQGVVDLRPPDHLADVQLVAAERARHLRVGLEEERCAPDQRSRVVTVGAQREVPVPVRPGSRSDHQRALGGPPEQVRNLTEVVRHEIALARQVRLAARRRQEVRDVAQMVTELAVDVAPFAQRLHLMDSDARELLGVLLEGVDELDRLAVGVRHHDVRAGLDVGEHRLRRRRLRGDPGQCHRRTLPVSCHARRASRPHPCRRCPVTSSTRTCRCGRRVGPARRSRRSPTRSPRSCRRSSQPPHRTITWRIATPSCSRSKPSFTSSRRNVPVIRRSTGNRPRRYSSM